MKGYLICTNITKNIVYFINEKISILLSFYNEEVTIEDSIKEFVIL